MVMGEPLEKQDKEGLVGVGKSIEMKPHNSTGVASFALLLGIVLHMGLLAKPLQGLLRLSCILRWERTP